MASRLLMRRDPVFQEFLENRPLLEDFFQRFLYGGPFAEFRREGAAGWAPPVEIYVGDDNKIHARVALPGILLKDVNVQIQHNQLTISGERKREREIKDEQFLQRELSYGHFERTIPLPEGVMSEKVEAQYSDGVLDIAVPLTEKVLPRRIEIKAMESGGQKRAA